MIRTVLVQIFLITLLLVFFQSSWSRYWLEYTELSISYAYISRVAPNVLIITFSLSILHFFVSRFMYKFSDELKKYYLVTGLLSIFLGCSKIIILMGEEAVKLTTKQKLTLLTVGMGATGGVTCLSMSAVGYRVESLLVVIFFLPCYLALCMNMILRERVEASTYQQCFKPKPLSFTVLSYLNGGCKLVANSAMVIVMVELFLINQFTGTNQCQQVSLCSSHGLQYFGLSPWLAEFMSTAIFEKLVFSRDIALIGMTTDAGFKTLSFVEEVITLLLTLSIGGVSAFLIVALNLMAMLGRDSISFIKLLPVATFLGCFLPLLPVIILAHLVL